MPYDFSKKIVQLKIKDRYTEEHFKILLSLPNSSDRISYKSDYTDLLVKASKDKSVGSKLIQDLQATHVEKFIISIEPGYFFKDGVEIDTSEKNKPEWFAMLKDERSDIIDVAATYLFGETAAVVKEDNLSFLKS